MVLRCKSGPGRMCKRSTSNKGENHVGESVIIERLYIDVKQDFFFKKKATTIPRE